MLNVTTYLLNELVDPADAAKSVLLLILALDPHYLIGTKYPDLEVIDSSQQTRKWHLDYGVSSMWTYVPSCD